MQSNIYMNGLKADVLVNVILLKAAGAEAHQTRDPSVVFVSLEASSIN